MISANSINDDELLLFFYRDGMDPARIAEIEDALFSDVDLRDRYEQLRSVLAHVDGASVVAPDTGFESRLWRALEPRIDAVGRETVPRGWSARCVDFLASHAGPRLAFAATCVLVLALGAAFLAGRRTAPELAGGPAAQASTGIAADRVLDAYVSAHLRATEGLLLTASNSDSAEILAGNRDLAVALVDSNRLYALAAARSGDLRLADFLRRLEPILLDLANQSPDAAIQDNEGLREYLRKTDLIFQVRATQARMQAVDASRT